MMIRIRRWCYRAERGFETQPDLVHSPQLAEDDISMLEVNKELSTPDESVVKRLDRGQDKVCSIRSDLDIRPRLCNPPP
jgi:hypothetical protein